MEARFWIMHNGSPVRLGLCDGESITVSSGGPHEEGYSYTYNVYTREGDHIYLESTTNACDCDGPLDTYTDLECRLDELDEWHYSVDGIKFPHFHRIRSRQRDHYAEAMGY